MRPASSADARRAHVNDVSEFVRDAARSNPPRRGPLVRHDPSTPAAAARVKYPAPAPTSKSAAERLCAEGTHERLRGRGLFRVPSTRLPPAVRGEDAPAAASDGLDA